MFPNNNFLAELNKKLERQNQISDNQEIDTDSSATATDELIVVDSPAIDPALFEILKKQVIELLAYKELQFVSDTTGYRKWILNILCQQEIEEINLTSATFAGLRLAMESIYELIEQYKMLNLQLDNHQRAPITYDVPESLLAITESNGTKLRILAANTSIANLLQKSNKKSKILIAIIEERQRIQIEKTNADDLSSLASDFSELGSSDEIEKAATLSKVFQDALNEIANFIAELKKNPHVALTNALLQGYERKKILTDKKRLKKQFLFDLLDTIYNRYLQDKHSSYDKTQADYDNIFYNARHLNAQLEGKITPDVKLVKENQLAIIYYLLQPHDEKIKFNDKSEAHKRLELILEINHDVVKDTDDFGISLADWLVIEALKRILKAYDTPLVNNIELALQAYQSDKDFRNTLPAHFAQKPTLLEYLNRIIFNDDQNQVSPLAKRPSFFTATPVSKNVPEQSKRRALNITASQKFDLATLFDEFENSAPLVVPSETADNTWQALLKLRTSNQLNLLKEDRIALRELAELFKQLNAIANLTAKQHQPAPQAYRIT